MIRGGGGKSSGYSADLMVCFPSRTHLSLPSKSISSPSNRRQTAPPHHHHRRSFSKLSGSIGVRQSRGREIAEEPTSPKVTCAGQIKVRPSKRVGGGGKSWQSLMAEIEKIHRSKSESKFLGIKKEVMGFLTCLRDFDFRCFGAFPPVDAVSDQEEEEEDDEDEGEEEDDEDGGSVLKTYSGTVFSDWLTFLHEKQNVEERVEKVSDNVETAVPPPNALLLMRCRSAPVKNWLEKEEEEKKIECNNNTRKQRREEEKDTVSKKKDLRSLMEEEEEEDVDMVVRDYDTNYYKLSSDIAKETWVVGGVQDSLYRSRSWNL